MGRFLLLVKLGILLLTLMDWLVFADAWDVRRFLLFFCGRTLRLLRIYNGVCRLLLKLARFLDGRR